MLYTKINLSLKFSEVAEDTFSTADRSHQDIGLEQNSNEDGDNMSHENHDDDDEIYNEEESNVIETENIRTVKLDSNMDYSILIKNMKTGFIYSAKSFKKKITHKVKNKITFLESTIAKCGNITIVTDLKAHLECLQVTLYQFLISTNLNYLMYQSPEMRKK